MSLGSGVFDWVVVAIVLLAVLSSVSIVGADRGLAAEENLTQDRRTAEANVTSGAVRWTNQTLYFRAHEPARSSGKVYEVRRVADGEIGQLLTKFVLNDDGAAVLRTGDVPPGQYVIVNENGQPLGVGPDGVSRGPATVANASWELVAQTLRIGATPTRVLQNETTELQIDSNRGRYPVLVSSSDMAIETLVKFVGGESVDTGGDGVADAVRIAATAMASRTIRVPDDISSGTYRLQFTVPDTGVNDVAVIRVREQPRTTVRFASPAMQVDRGDIVTFQLRLNRTQTATAWIGSRSRGYLTRLRVIDGNADGKVTVRINTYSAGRVPRDEEKDVFAAVSRSDIVSNVTRYTPQRDVPLSVGEYPLNATVEGRETGGATLFLTSRSNASLTIHTAPGRSATDTLAKIRDVVSSQRRIATGDKLVLRIETTGMSGFFDASYDLSQNSPDARQHGAYLTIGRENASDQARTLDVSAADLLVADDAGTIYAVFEPDTLDVRAGEPYRARFVISDANPLLDTGERQVAAASFTIVERRATFENTQKNASHIRVPVEGSFGGLSKVVGFSGKSTVAPGTQLLVTLRTNDKPFVFENRTTTVQSDGEWLAEFDFGGETGLDPNRRYVIKVRHGSKVISNRFVVALYQATETPTATTTQQNNDMSGSFLFLGLLVMGGVAIGYLQWRRWKSE